ncbi:MAG: stalk domain-containing protein [Syntrophomonadaceae bacterium]|nr:stalk domain-containing protein [Syntrophomonadaceae bacterium]
MKLRKMPINRCLIIGLVLTLFFAMIPSQAQAEVQKTIRIYMDGKEILPPQDQAAVIINDRTMVPLRVISEGLGLTVDWDHAGFRVLIGSTGFQGAVPPASMSDAKIPGVFMDGKEIKPKYANPVIINDRILLSVRDISETIGRKVEWDQDNYMVLVMSPPSITVSAEPQTPAQVVEQPPETQQITQAPAVDGDIAIMGESVASSEQLRALLKQNNPQAPDLADLYLEIGKIYGIRGDIAFCQAAKETGWWKFGGLALPEQNNYCGLSVTGRAATASEDLKGANPAKVQFIEGKHGAFFDCPASGVEAHIQHLYAYASSNPLPAGRDLLDPRFALIKRGLSPRWIDLGGKWAVPGYDKSKFASIEEALAVGESYGHSILKDYYNKAVGEAIQIPQTVGL